jgi:glycosyltransferase involved in cell wall biosynthesis
MPKTGLLAMNAAFFARVPVRIHTFTGQVWVTRTGFWRFLLKTMDRVIALSATDVYADSPSQRDFLLEQKVIRSGKVLGDGSVSGVDSELFRPNTGFRRSIRDRFGISEETVVFGFVGRLNRDKGIYDLVNAFESLPVEADACLLFVGADEEGIEQQVREALCRNAVASNVWKKIHFAGHTSEPERFYAAFDVFCMPSYREGFGSSVIEAAACGVPALVSRIYGLTDAVAEGETGLMHDPGDIEGIRLGLERFLNDASLRHRMGRVARQRVLEKFSRDRLVHAMIEEYEQLLNE